MALDRNAMALLIGTEVPDTLVSSRPTSAQRQPAGPAQQWGDAVQGAGRGWTPQQTAVQQKLSQR
ncbi:hypothetical protein [Sphaerotilus hippei]|uniref:hypothetical protein n=1 Tax=Sphaerotilus hippei TaxID=744406 RepID=UPI0014736ADE|nr:hypothetical protein [Sphaerotilus hippei]